MSTLTPKQNRFVEEYLVDLCATKAATRAGYSPRTANRQGSRLLANTEIKEMIEVAKAGRAQKLATDSETVLQRLVDEANADMADLFTAHGDILPVHKWPEIWRAGLVQSFEVEALYRGTGKDRVQIGVVKKIRFSDRLRRLELIGKHVRVQAFRENVQYTSLDGLDDRLENAFKRLREVTS